MRTGKGMKDLGVGVHFSLCIVENCNMFVSQFFLFDILYFIKQMVCHLQ